MQIGLIGQKEFVVSRRDMLSDLTNAGKLPIVQIRDIPWSSSGNEEWLKGNSLLFEQLDVVLVAVPAAFLFEVTSRVLKAGLHTYLNWNTAISISEYERLAGLAEEAGAELGIDLPYLFHPIFRTLPAHRSASILSIQQIFDTPSASRFQKAIEQAIELCYHYSNTGEVQRIDAQSVKSISLMPDSLLASIRFQNGTYAHVHLSQIGPSPVYNIQASGHGFNIHVDMDQGILRQTHVEHNEENLQNGYKQPAFEVSPIAKTNLHERALEAFLESISKNTLPPVSILDGLQIKRIIEKLRKCLR